MIDIRHSENLAGMSELLATHRDAFTLAYLDPPFRTGKRQIGPAGSYEDPAVEMGEFVSGLMRRAYEPLAPSTLKTWGTGKQLAVVENGRRKRSSTTDEPTRGTPMGDVWDIGIVAPVAKERTGWPTQKPEALLERLVLACTNPGDLVLDPYLGSGTTPAVCARLGRDCIAFDENIDAVTVARKRLEGVKPC